MKKLKNLDISKVLEFKPTPKFGKWRKYFPNEAVQHPAKINLNLLEYLIKEYTNEGDLILDPMAGTFSTVVLAMLHNRNAIGVDLEEKFCKWGREAVERVKKEFTLSPKGKGLVLQGDARKLTELLSGVVDSVIFSPPYAEANRGGGIAKKGYKGKYGEDPNLHLRHDRPISDNPDNIDNVPYGNIDTVIFSPPYSGSVSGTNNPERRRERLIEKGYNPDDFLGGNARCSNMEWRYSHNKENIGNLYHGSIDAIITSPPYEEAMGKKHHSPRADKIIEEKRAFCVYSENPENIGNLKSENYSTLKNLRGSIEEVYNKLKSKTGKPTYLSEMLLVYDQCYKVLKPKGKLIVVVKCFIRNFKLIPLHEHTRILCELVGFKLKEMLAFKLPQKSFWRILYQKKYGDKIKDLHLLDYEFILVFEKP